MSLPPGSTPYGGWEDPSVEVRGHFVGHYLSALAFAYISTSKTNVELSKRFKVRSEVMVQGLAACQQPDGYLSAFPTEFFDRLESLQPVWAPYYVIHKIMAGLLDQHRYLYTSEATATATTTTTTSQPLEVLQSMADYFCARIYTNVINNAQKGIQYWNQILENEFGGMNDVLYTLSSLQQREGGDRERSFKYKVCASFFDKPSFYQPMLSFDDSVLPGLHANTHLAQVNGFAARYEATGEIPAAMAVANFFFLLAQKHTFSTGGTNWFEHWGPSNSLADPLEREDAGGNTQESCTTYNILKIARSLFLWTGFPEFVDFYERGLLNGVVGVQRLEDGGGDHHVHENHQHHHDRALRMHSIVVDDVDAVALHTTPQRPFLASNTTTTPGQYIYYLPLGPGGPSKADNPHSWTKGWGTPFESFWCCYGTAVESFAKLADSIYFWSDDDDQIDTQPSKKGKSEDDTVIPRVYVNQFTSSTLHWNDLGVVVDQDADLYDDDGNGCTTRTTGASTNDNVGCAKVTLTVSLAANTSTKTNTAPPFYLYIRSPAWVDVSRTTTITLNGVDASPFIATSVPSSSSRFFSPLIPKPPPPSLHLSSSASSNRAAEYIVLGPVWGDGDVVDVRWPLGVVAENLNDARPQFSRLKALMMGPFVMAGLYGTDDTNDRSIDVDVEDVDKAVQRIPEGKRGEFPPGSRMLVGKTKAFVIAPLGQLGDERYTAYFEFVGEGEVGG